jgi:hypothetical protein
LLSFITLLLFLNNFSYAEESIDNFLDDPSYSDSFQEVDQVGNHIKSGNDNYHPLEPVKRTLNLEQPPSKYKAILKKGSLLTDMVSQKESYTQKDIYVITRQQFEGGQYSFIFNKKGELAYKTLTKNITSIENEIIIHPEVDAAYINPKKTSFNTIDSFLLLDNSVSVGLTTINSPQNLATIGLESGSASGTTFEFRSIAKSSLPVHFGVELEYLSAKGFNESNEQVATWSSLNFGPVIKYPFYKYEGWDMSTLVSLHRSLSYSLVTDDNAFAFSSSTWKLQLLGEKDYQYGALALGLAYFKEKSTIEPKFDESISITSAKNSTTGFSFTIGYNFELNL